MFRIELEYGDGLLKWVVYRELRDFVNLHAHYRVANVKHAVDRFPSFPKVSIPYYNFLKKERSEKGGTVPGKAEFAKMQREAMETYLLKLVRAVVSKITLLYWWPRLICSTVDVPTRSESLMQVLRIVSNVHSISEKRRFSRQTRLSSSLIFRSFETQATWLPSA